MVMRFVALPFCGAMKFLMGSTVGNERNSYRHTPLRLKHAGDKQALWFHDYNFIISTALHISFNIYKNTCTTRKPVFVQKDFEVENPYKFIS
jgi:hypothetical protein